MLSLWHQIIIIRVKMRPAITFCFIINVSLAVGLNRFGGAWPPPRSPRREQHQMEDEADWQMVGGDCLVMEPNSDTRASEQNISASEEDLSTSEEDLSIFEQNFRASQQEPDLRVSDQDLRVSDQDLSTSDQDIRASEQEPDLRMSNDLDCGLNKYDSDRIVGGTESDPHRFPWMAAMTLFGNQFCGGSVINKYYVLTAAHCIAWGPQQALAMTLTFSDHDLVSNNETSTPVVTRKVRKLKMHAKYDAKNTDYDIALIELDEPLEFGEDLGPVCMPTGLGSLKGAKAIVTGWGHQVQGGNPSDQLRQVSVDIISNRRCQRRYRNDKLTQRMLCAGAREGGRDACQGDSGGPLVIKSPNSGRWIQAGIVSWGRGCALKEFPGVYTRLTEFLDWVKKHGKRKEEEANP